MKKIDLRKQFRIINKLCFRGKLKMLRLDLCNKIYSRGRHYWKSYIPGSYRIQGVFWDNASRISIARHFHFSVEKELDIMHTLGHEMLHYYDFVRGKKRVHGGGFRKECKIVENKITKYYFEQKYWKDYRKNKKIHNSLAKRLRKEKKYEMAKNMRVTMKEYKRALINLERLYLK